MKQKSDWIVKHDYCFNMYLSDRQTQSKLMQEVHVHTQVPDIATITLKQSKEINKHWVS